jgi:hypothetical protein
VPPIVSSVEIHRPPDEVFAYVTDPARFAECQLDAAGGPAEAGHKPSVGARYTTIRRTAGSLCPRRRPRRSRRLTLRRVGPPRGTGGPVRENVRYTVENLHGNKRSRVTIELDFEGHGIGRLLVPLIVRRQARKEMLINCRKLKERLEGGL